MTNDNSFKMPGAEQMAAFWTDFMGKMAQQGAAPPAEFAERTRKSFFEAMSRYYDEYFRSEQFLQMMKQSLDASLAWQQQMNQYLQKGLAAAQMPSREDADHVTLLVRGMEERLLDGIEKLSKRIDRLEKQHAKGSSE